QQLLNPALPQAFARRHLNANEVINLHLVLLRILQEQVLLLQQILLIGAHAKITNRRHNQRYQTRVNLAILYAVTARSTRQFFTIVQAKKGNPCLCQPHRFRMTTFYSTRVSPARTLPKSQNGAGRIIAWALPTSWPLSD